VLTDDAGPVPLSLGTIAELNAWSVPELEAVVDGARRVTWAELHDRTARLAGALGAKLNASRGDRVAFLGMNCLETIELFHATARAGLLCVPLNERLSPAELRAIVESVEPVALLCTASHADLASELVSGTPAVLVGVAFPAPLTYDDLLMAGRPMPAVEPEPVSSICFTSGTTGRPKGVLMTQRAQCLFARVQAELEPIRPRARHLYVRPIAVAPGHRMIAWHGISQGTTSRGRADHERATGPHDAADAPGPREPGAARPVLARVHRLWRRADDGAAAEGSPGLLPVRPDAGLRRQRGRAGAVPVPGRPPGWAGGL